MIVQKTVFVLCFLIIFILTALAGAETGNPQETLKQYMSDLQKNPDDFALREKIIKLVQGMKPQPATPEEAQRHLGRGQAAVEIAKTSDDFLLAISEFKKVLSLAPWLANAYFNLAVVQEKAGQFNEAMQNYKLYLLAAPSAADAQEVKTRIYGLELKAERQQKEVQEKTALEQREKQKNEALNKFKRMVEGNSYIAVYCTYDQSQDLGGCNEQEYNNERNWHAWPVGWEGEEKNVNFSFTSDGEIILNTRIWGRIIGTIEGSDISNIRWTGNKGMSVWIRASADWSSFTIGNGPPVSNKRDFFIIYRHRHLDSSFFIP